MAEIAVATAIGWVVSPVIRLIIEKTQNYISSKLSKQAGVENDMAKMETSLLEILSIMATVEKQRIVDQNQVKLVWKIKDAVYDAEDVLDKLEYSILEKECEKQKNTVSRIASSPHVVYRDTVGNLMFKNMVKAVNEKLNQAKASAKELLQLMHVNNTSNVQTREYETGNWNLTSSIITEKIIGRENERVKLIDLLFEQVEGPPTIIQIIGQGGIGKTILAQMVFNDPRLDNHFDQKIWLTVSDQFNKLRLTKEMLTDVCRNFSTVNSSFNNLQRELETGLGSKKVLLILDDVWCVKDENQKYTYQKEWLDFIAPLNKTKAGSKIIMTSRQGLESIIFSSQRSISLAGLNVNDSWSLFDLCAFNDKNEYNRKELEPIGKKIVNRLKGLSLAIRVVGTRLKGNSDVQEWNSTLNDNLLDTGDIMKILRRSYDYLPEHLKHCFAYCSLFPKKYHLKPDRLVHMWIAHGFVHSEDRMKLEDVGKSYFKALLDRSFLQVIKKGEKKCYVMHDLMNDLACYVSKGECYILDKDDSMRNLRSIRHLSVTLEAIDILKNMNGLDKLCTLMLLCGSNKLKIDISKEDISNLFIMLKRIRVLDIEWEMKNLCGIAHCKHLRYISVRRFSMVLPDSLTKLHLLSALFVRKSNFYIRSVYNEFDPTHPSMLDNLKLPKFLNSMSNFITVDTSKTLAVDIGELVPPQTLWKGGPASLCVGNKKRAPRLNLLGDFNNIKGSLVIHGLENAIREEAIKAELCRKEHVAELDLNWKKSSLDVKTSRCHAVLEALNPNPNLKLLSISGYPGVAWPSWLESDFLFTVKSIKLYGCRNIKMLPSLGQLPLLQHLHIAYMPVRKIGFEFYGNGGFPSLENLEIGTLLSLEEWSYPCDSSVFPKLNKLTIRNCPMLQLDNDFLVPQYMDISCFYGMESIPVLHGDISNFKGLTTLSISFCSGLITLQGLHELVSLQRFFIERCPDLSSLPEMEFFYSLEVLAIVSLPKLESFPKKGFPVSLQLLFMGGRLHHDLMKQIRSKKGHDWDKIAAISECNLYSSNASSWSASIWAKRIFSSKDSIRESVSRFGVMIWPGFYEIDTRAGYSTILH